VPDAPSRRRRRHQEWPDQLGRYVRGDIEDPHLTNALLDANDDDPECGYRLVASELQWAVLTFGFVRIQE